MNRLMREDGVLRVGDLLVLGDLADQALALVGEARRPTASAACPAR